MNWADCVNQHTTVYEALRRYPVLQPLFEELGFPASCRDCALVAMAHRMRLEPQELVTRINEFLAASVARRRGD